MVSKRTNRGFALKGVDGNCVFLPMGIISRAKKGGGYDKMRRRVQSRGETGTALTAATLPVSTGWAGPLVRG